MAAGKVYIVGIGDDGPQVAHGIRSTEILLLRASGLAEAPRTFHRLALGDELQRRHALQRILENARIDVQPKRAPAADGQEPGDALPIGERYRARPTGRRDKRRRCEQDTARQETAQGAKTEGTAREDARPPRFVSIGPLEGERPREPCVGCLGGISRADRIV